MKVYSMRGVMGAAEKAVELARAYLLAADPASRVHDVQDDPRFQHRGVDLLWDRPAQPVSAVEVKGDRQSRRRTYFFELVSNLERDTPGCFLYSAADLYLYVFVDSREVHHLPLKDTRAWFLERAKEFPLKHTRTRVGQRFYTTLGAAVPIRRVQGEVALAGIWPGATTSARVAGGPSRARPRSSPPSPGGRASSSDLPSSGR